jgi:hypothetical protein
MAKKTTPPADVEAAEPETETPSTAVAIVEPVTERPAFIDLIKFAKKDESIKIIKEKSAEYAKVKIDGIEDKANYALVAANMKQMKDDRIAFENAAYANVIDPLKKALKDYADDIDSVVEEFKAAEKLERDKKDFIDDEKKRIKKEREEAKAKAAQMRITELMVLGAKFDGQLYTFDYDAGLLINSLQLVDFSDEEYGEFLDEVKTAFAEEQTRLHEEKLRLEEKENERLLESERQRQLAQKNADESKQLNERRTNLRIKELKLLGAIKKEDGDYIVPSADNYLVTLYGIESAEDRSWDELIFDLENFKPYVVPTPEVSVIADSEIPAFVQEFEESVIALPPLKALAKRLDRTDIRAEFPSTELVDYLKANNFVLVYGHSDDLVEMDGIIYDEADKYRGGQLHFNSKGWCTKAKSLGSIKAVFGANKYCWSFITDVPHVAFEMVDSEDEDYLSQAIIFDLNVLKQNSFEDQFPEGQESPGAYQPLFDLMSDHGLTLLENEMYEIIRTVRQMDGWDINTAVIMSFSKEEPFNDFDISGKLKMRIYPDRFNDEALAGVDVIANQGKVQGLNWIILKK